MTDKDNGSWLFSTLAAAAVLTVTMGARQSLGLFIFPLNNSTGLGLVTISFALAVGQFAWGAVQPLAGAAADRFGPARVLVGGVLMLALGSALTPFMTSALGLVISLGLLSAIGAGAGSFSVLIGAVAGRVPASQRGSAAGLINAGGSFGQFVFAPLLQLLISTLGWMAAMWSLAVITLAALPLVRMMDRASPVYRLVNAREIRGDFAQGRQECPYGPQLFIATRGFLYLRLSYRADCDALAR